ncbi:hypothetical protein ACTG2N_06140 [Aeromonas hydrophila]|uniref:hypothetical protein n=1 Tax=Aeromonas hydrophila TaxID=644 RepID=UPI003F7A821E
MIYYSKQLFRVKEKKKNLPKYGKRVTKESNWKDYQSSNAEVQGWAISDCEYSVLYLCGAKYEISYREVQSLIDCHGLRDPMCMNQMMGMAKIGKCPSDFKLL